MQTPKRPKQYHRYKNLSGKSTVSRYEALRDSINIEFTDGTAYRYTNQTAEPANISKMKELAVAGNGLGTFIKATIKDRFERKIR
jgi:hypothetical protein